MTGSTLPAASIRQAMKPGNILAGLGAGVLFTLPYTSPLLSPDHLVIYHSRLPLDSVADALLIDFVVLAIVGTLVVAYLERSGSGRLHPAWILIGVCVVLVAVVVITDALQRPDQHRYLIRAGGAVLVLALVCRWLWPGIYRAYSRALLSLFLLAGISAVWIVPELGWLALAHPIPVAASPLPAAAVTVKHRRIVWVLFDELSYDQTFGHRNPSVPMPEFDKLARTSIVFSDLQPTAYYTQLAIPSLFLGEDVESLKSNMEGAPRLRFEGGRNWHKFDARATVFGEARQRGWTTGVVGWYNPYCRILDGVLDSCYTDAGDLEPNRMFSGNSALKNAVLPIQGELGKFVHVYRPPSIAEGHEMDYRDVMRHAQALLADENIRFLYIHLPIPHPPGIYDRKTGQLRAGGDYLDNLALSDRTLGELLSDLSRTASANQTTLVVCSDHSWRVPMWRRWAGWTVEEEAASKGVFDPRPVLMIHFPAESGGLVVTRPFAEVRLTEILRRMIEGRMATQEAFVDWLDGAEPTETSPSPVVAEYR